MSRLFVPWNVYQNSRHIISIKLSEQNLYQFVQSCILQLQDLFIPQNPCQIPRNTISTTKLSGQSLCQFVAKRTQISVQMIAKRDLNLSLVYFSFRSYSSLGTPAKFRSTLHHTIKLLRLSLCQFIAKRTHICLHNCKKGSKFESCNLQVFVYWQKNIL